MEDVDQMILFWQGRLASLAVERERLDQQINAAKQSLNGLLLYRKASAEPQSSKLAVALLEKFRDVPRLGQACKNAVNALGTRVTPVEVRDQLRRAGFDFTAYSSNPLSSIHTALRRLAENHEIEAIRDLNTGKIVGFEPTPASKLASALLNHHGTK
jgi:hypothetical protein